MHVLIPLCLGAILLTSCYLPDRNLKRMVDEEEIPGVWEATEHFRGLLKRYPTTGVRPSAVRIEFNPDSTFLFSSIHDDFASFEFVETRGTWKLEKRTRSDSNIEKENAIIMSFDDERFYSNYSMDFAEEDGRLILWCFFGDPDSWEFIEYQKVAGEAATR